FLIGFFFLAMGMGQSSALQNSDNCPVLSGTLESAFPWVFPIDLIKKTEPYNQTRNNLGLKNKIICIDPGHGGTSETDSYRVGPSGEREEWINLRVGLLLREMLEKEGAKVLMTRTTDVQVPLQERSALAIEGKADLFISIHHNATADGQVNFPIIYFHGSANENKAGLALGKALAGTFRDHL